MKHLIIPFIILAIGADVYCWQYYDTKIDSYTFFLGETCVYFAWVSAFLIYAKWTPEGLHRKIIISILWMFLPFAVNAIYRQYAGLGLYKSEADWYVFLISCLVLFIQILYWKLKK